MLLISLWVLDLVVAGMQDWLLMECLHGAGVDITLFNVKPLTGVCCSGLAGFEETQYGKELGKHAEHELQSEPTEH